MFHATFGSYAQGVVESTAILPRGWESRLVRFETPATNGVVSWRPEVHDLWISKAVASRPKDKEFFGALVEAGLVGRKILLDRLADIDHLDSRIRDAVEHRICAF